MNPYDLATLATRWTLRPSSVLLGGAGSITQVLGANVDRWCVLFSNPVGVPGLNAFLVPQTGNPLVQFAAATSAVRFDQKDFGAMVTCGWAVNNQGAAYTIGILELLWK